MLRTMGLGRLVSRRRGASVAGVVLIAAAVSLGVVAVSASRFSWRRTRPEDGPDEQAGAPEVKPPPARDADTPRWDTPPPELLADLVADDAIAADARRAHEDAESDADARPAHEDAEAGEDADATAAPPTPAADDQTPRPAASSSDTTPRRTRGPRNRTARAGARTRPHRGPSP